MEVSKEEFNQMLLDDQEAQRQQGAEDALLERKLRVDPEFFREYFNDEYTMAIEAIEELIRIHKMYDLEFDIKIFEDEL